MVGYRIDDQKFIISFYVLRTVCCWSRLHLQSSTSTVPHWAHVFGYGTDHMVQTEYRLLMCPLRVFSDRPARRGEQILIALKTEVLVFVVRFIFACAPLVSFRMPERAWWEIIRGADRLRSRTFSRSRSRSAPIACSSERIRFQTASCRPM
jgi:hypothetical protein